MPIGSVQDLHCGNPSKGSSGKPDRGRVGAGFGTAGGPRREGELEHQRYRQLGLAHDHRARLDERRALPLHGGQEAVFAAGCLGGVEAADHADGRVGDDAPFDFARRLLRADKDDAERSAALGDVQQDLLDRARPFTRGVLVELVEHDEQQRPCGARTFLVVEGLAQDHADDEPLGAVVEVVDVDDGHLMIELHAVLVRVRHVGADQRREVADRSVQAADERVDRAGTDGATGPRPECRRRRARVTR